MQDVLHATRSVILLTDADGVILESFGAQRHINYAAERNLHAARVGSFYF
jgi:transcriptional regulator of acetoin/glycerol metabolism